MSKKVFYDWLGSILVGAILAIVALGFGTAVLDASRFNRKCEAANGVAKYIEGKRRCLKTTVEEVPL